MAGARKPVVEVRRSERRRRTVSAYRDGERVVVLIPNQFSRAEESEWVDKMLARLAARDQRQQLALQFAVIGDVLREGLVSADALGVSTGFHDGIAHAAHAIPEPVRLDAFREGAAINVVLVTDENRDVLDPSLSFASTFTALE
jgi:hypothetical protein